MKPYVCVPCKKFYRVKKNSVTMEECMPLDKQQTQWGPYKLWDGDLWECPSCGHQLLSGFGSAPISDHYQENYNTWRESLSKRDFIVIKDC